MTVYINFIGAPCSGKSTLAAQLFGELKQKHYEVELVREYAKDLTWAGRDDILGENQLLVSGETFERLRILKGKVNFVISDTSILLGSIYDTEIPYFDEVLLHLYNILNPNINIFLHLIKDVKYSSIGRTQSTEKIARELENKIETKLFSLKIPYINTPDNDRLNFILNYLSENKIIQ